MDYSNYKKIKITNNKLDFWLKKNKNVLLIGNHGVGKTSIVMDGFERNGIFMDEYNRTNPKVRNALMELIQFKSINGRKFPNLKVVWAA